MTSPSQSAKFVDLVQVTRGNLVENIHQGIAIAINSNNQIIKKWGDITTEIFPRSALKPIQTFGIFSSGTYEALQLSDERIAFATSSHHAEPLHIEMAKQWLKDLKLDESNFTLGPSWPLGDKRREDIVRNDGVKTKIYHNCSGKHLGQLSICVHKNFNISEYDNPSHPVQQLFIKNLEQLSEIKIKNIAIDGCGLPAPALPLERFAFALTKFADPQQLSGLEQAAAKKIVQCCVDHPVYFGGSQSVNSILTKSSNKKILVKNGADGVFAAIVPDKKMVVVVKIKDGNMKAAEVAIAGLLLDLKLLDHEIVQQLAHQPITNSVGVKSGSIKWIG